MTSQTAEGEIICEDDLDGESNNEVNKAVPVAPANSPTQEPSQICRKRVCMWSLSFRTICEVVYGTGVAVDLARVAVAGNTSFIVITVVL